ncbi:CRISPR-associated endonuclease Cas2 [Candidatus Poribacteria bacterium]|nr:CRISPR-associated endonuclease Cas2 [Candidatus Poribacteria bacterium]
MFYVISYDIPDNQRRNRLAKVLKGFGSRVQYSVFEAHLTQSQFEQMKQAVNSVINSDEDAVRYYALCSACVERIEVPAVGDVTVTPETIVV